MIFVGRIWQLGNKENDEGLRKLLNEGFIIKVWDKLHNRLYPGDTTTKNYLVKLETMQ